MIPKHGLNILLGILSHVLVRSVGGCPSARNSYGIGRYAAASPIRWQGIHVCVLRCHASGSSEHPSDLEKLLLPT